MVIGIDASRAEAKLKTGVERYSFEIIRAMRDSLPPSAEVILYSYAPLPAELGPWNDKWRNKVLAWPPLYFWTLIRLSWEMWRHPPDVLFVPAYRLPLIKPKRSVATIHDATFLEFPQLYSTAEVALQKNVLADGCRRADAIIVPSFFTKDQLAACKPAHIEVVPHGVSVAVHPFLNSTSRHPGESRDPRSSSTHYSLPTTPYFVILGRVDKKKNIIVAVDGFAKFAAQHPDHRLLIVGRPSFGFAEIEAQIKSFPAADKIEFVGPLPDEQMADLVRNAVALVHPCPVEGFGLPVIEAMSLGTPVIAANHGAAAEAAGDAALLVPPTDPDKWAEAMEQITFDIFRKPLIEKAKERAKLFAWPRAAAATWKVLMNK